MRTFRFDKLVRDKIVDQMEAGGAKAVWRRLNDEEFEAAVIKKLEEELDELDEGVGQDRARDMGELADVAEVYETALKSVDQDEHYDILEIAMDEIDKGIDMWQITPDEFLAAKQAKLDKVGGFERRIFIDTVTLPDDDPWIKTYLNSPERYPEITG